MPKLSVGDIFSVLCNRWNQTTVLKYWKVTEIGKSFWDNGLTYQVILCSKTGKEFRNTTGFSTTIDQKFGAPDSRYTIVKQGGTVGDKANIDQGILTGKTKRRLQYLRARVAKDTAEIQRIEEQLNTKES